MSASDCVLIVAGSGRMLAEAARLSNLRPLVIDLYADQDTQAQSLEVCALPSLDVESVAPVLADLMHRYGVTRAVYGSGLETHSNTVAYLAERMTLLGNPPAVYLRLLHKADFFRTLAALNIPFPEVSFSVRGLGDWLCKPMRGQGGMGIRRNSGNPNASGVYWQRFQPGTPGSVLFLADTQEVRIVGFNKQLTTRLPGGLEFAFSGLINRIELPRVQQDKLSGWARDCVRAFGLKGLNTLDFIQNGENLFVLEINPRPSASMQLYDALLPLHIEACQGRIPQSTAESRTAAGFRIVYADRSLRIPWGFAWPDWVRDRPAPGARIDAGRPLCSVFSERPEPEQVAAELGLRERLIFNQLVS